MTPAPSEVPQLSTVKWGQSKIVASLPVHCTLSIAKELVSKVPKWEFLVGVPSGYPNILQRYFLGIAITRQEIKCFTQVNFQFYPKKCLHRNIFGKQLRIQDVLFTYFEQVVSLFANFYSNTKSLQLFCAKSSLISTNFHRKANLSNSKSGYYYALLAVISLCELLANYIKKTQCQVWSGQKCDVLQLALSFDKLCHNATAHQKGLIKKLASALPADYKCIFCIMVIITDRKSTNKDVPFLGPWAANQLYFWNMFNQEWTIQNVEFDIFI